MLRQLIAKQTIRDDLGTLLARSVSAATLECSNAHRSCGEANQRRAKHNDREGYIKKENADEGGRREPNQSLVLE